MVTRLKTGRCEIEEYWLSVLFEDGQYESTENILPVGTYLHEDRTYVAKTWIFKNEETDFYVVNTIYDTGKRLTKVIESVPLDQDKFGEKSEESFGYFDRQFRMLGLKINGVNSLIKTLRQEVVTKEDLQRTEAIFVENQKIIQEILKEKINELRPEIEIEIEQKIGKNETSRFWRILERLSTIGGAIEFAKCVKELVSFLNEHKIVQTVLPLLVGLLMK